MNANTLNAHLSAGGIVQVTTYAKSWLYEQKHAGYFSESNGQLFVQHGKRKDCLGRTDAPMVSIRLGRYQATAR